MQTLLIWLILVESAIKNGTSSNDQDIWQKTHLCWNLQCDPLLHYPSCSITCWKYTFLQYTNFVASSNCNYFQLQLTNSNWVGPLSLAQLCPSLFLIFMLNWSNLQSSYRTLYSCKAITRGWSPSSTYHQVPPNQQSTQSALAYVKPSPRSFP